MQRFSLLALWSVLIPAAIVAGEKTIVSLRDLSHQELRTDGIEINKRLTLKIRALGGGGDHGWTHKSSKMFAYGWILDASNRQPVWEMTTSNSKEEGDDRLCEETITLEPGSYEVYFAATHFSYHTTFTHFTTNVDHRRSPLFGGEGGDGFFWGITKMWSEDIEEEWNRRSPHWGMDLTVDDAHAGSVKKFKPPRQQARVVLKTTDVGDNAKSREGFEVSSSVTLSIRGIGENPDKSSLVDFGWIVNAETREEVWGMNPKESRRAGGARKNILCTGRVTLPKGEYVLYYASDDSHSPEDWNDAPPYDPFGYGVTIFAENDADAKKVRLTKYQETRNTIVQLTRVGDDAFVQEGFSLKAPTRLRIYAFGERSNDRRQLADLGYIINAETRDRVWSMQADRVRHAGGASKNVYVDEIITLPKGSYLVFYRTDDSHSYEDWNSRPPIDQEHYGITVMGAGPNFDPSVVGKYVEERDKNVIAQIIRVGDDVDKRQAFKLDKTTRVRVFALGEGQKHEMHDYGWIEDARGTEVWAMTYGITDHAGGGRKNRVANTTIVLEKGSYVLRFVSDDSHSYNDWNVDPPEDPEYWGITLFRAGSESVHQPHQPIPPIPPEIE